MTEYQDKLLELSELEEANGYMGVSMNAQGKRIDHNEALDYALRITRESPAIFSRLEQASL